MNISIFGSYSENNLGDEAILEGLLSFLDQQEGHSMVVFSHRPTKSAKIHDFLHVSFVPMIATGIRSFAEQLLTGVFFKSFRTLRHSDVIIIGGGGLFHEKEVDQSGFSPLFVWFLRMILFRFFVRKPVYLLGIGISKLQKLSSKWFMKKILQWSEVIMVRDKVSIPNSQSVIDNSRYTVISDLAWLKEVDQPMRSFDMHTSLYCALQLREVLNLDKKKLLQEMSVFVELLVEYFHADISFLPLSLLGPDDRAIQQELIAMSDHQKNLHLLPCSTPERVRTELQKVNIVITTRFHGFILALQTGAIPIVLSYASKTDALVEEFHLFCRDRNFPLVPSFSVHEVSAPQLLDAIQYIYIHENDLQKALRAFVQQKKKEVREYMTTLL